MPMKRGDRLESERKMLEKINTEHTLFQYKMFSGTAREVYKTCRKICFYECVFEYFQYSEEISTDFVSATEGSDGILAELWKIYLKHEYLRVDTWEEIGIILDVYVSKYT